MTNTVETKLERFDENFAFSDLVFGTLIWSAFLEKQFITDMVELGTEIGTPPLLAPNMSSSVIALRQLSIIN